LPFHDHPHRNSSAQLFFPRILQLVLLSIENDNKRLKYKELAKTHNWSRAKLIAALKSEKLISSSGSRPGPLNTTPHTLNPHIGLLYTYRSAPGASGYVYVDVGFSVTRQIKSWLLVEKGDVIRSRKSAKGFELQKVRALPKDLYTYRAYVEKVVDGDTLRLHIDLGFDTFIKEKVRLRGINTPEIKTPAGQRAKRYVSMALKQANEIIVKTHWEDKYGRYLIDLWADGEYLNQQLIDEGLAQGYKE